MADPLTTNLRTNYDAIYSNRNLQSIYLSPEQCESLESNKPIPNKNAYKNDVFTLGMIMLECGLLDRQNNCYLDECAKVHWNQIRQN